MHSSPFVPAQLQVNESVRSNLPIVGIFGFYHAGECITIIASRYDECIAPLLITSFRVIMVDDNRTNSTMLTHKKFASDADIQIND